MKNPYKHAFSGVHDFVHKKLSESMVGARVVNTHKGTNREGWEGKVVGVGYNRIRVVFEGCNQWNIRRLGPDLPATYVWASIGEIALVEASYYEKPRLTKVRGIWVCYDLLRFATAWSPEDAYRRYKELMKES